MNESLLSNKELDTQKELLYSCTYSFTPSKHTGTLIANSDIHLENKEEQILQIN